MRAWSQHRFRVAFRLIWLGWALSLAALDRVVTGLVSDAKSLPAARARWMQRQARRLLRVFHVEARHAGDAPTRGLLVCNHLSYVDILVLAAISPCAFVAKREVRRWPVFGWFARQAGTVFVDREKRLRTGESANEIESALDSGMLLVLFAEGTSSGGETVLPFKSALLDPALRLKQPLTVAYLAYEVADGSAREDVCYWRDMTLVPHLVKLLSKSSVRASVQFRETRCETSDRKELARQLHQEVVRLKASAETAPASAPDAGHARNAA